MNNTQLTPVGHWRSGARSPVFEPAELGPLLESIREPMHVVRDLARARIGLAMGGSATTTAAPGDLPLLATLPATFPEWLGDRSFCETHGVRFPYVAGEMANGIATTRLCIAMAEAGMIGFFGAGGLGYPRVEEAVDELVAKLGNRLPWGVNLIHSPNEAGLENRVADLLIRKGVPIISASAFMGLTPAVVRCAAAGLQLDANDRIVRKHRVFAKISRREVAIRFMSPAPADMLRALVAQNLLTQTEADLAAKVPVAEDITVEADSGGHTDNQLLVALFPTIMALRDELVAQHGYDRPIRVGAAGGLGTPGSLAAAFSMGAAYVVTGSVNQAAVEAGLSDAGKAMLAEADVADVIMAPAADMFELGVNVQVLKRGTMFGVRSSKLYEAWHSNASLEAIPLELKTRLERDVLHATFDEIWAETRGFWQKRDPAEVVRAEADPKHRMALVFRWYLGKASKWAIDGEVSRRADYQIWSGPAMGAFNRWAAGSFLAEPKNRSVVQIALNLLEGAAVITRAGQLRSFGLPVPATSFQFRPRLLS
ncbi:PfaD family polyunsaturated fatty acid/polyketide biosynthesis protein [Propionivibrio sp.]|uniref:PfaD family polyunsaturated fatty acid/polyketide biosynthesis protein n=1 Tax=Propionivibrio sp. TaxID=2212460 RepID=UPI003BF2684C